MDTLAKTKPVNIFAVGNVLDPHIAIQGKCRACKGTGKGEFWSRCRECDKKFFPDRSDTGDFTPAEFAAAVEAVGDGTTPCGHNWSNWRESDVCPECGGTCTATDFVRLSDIISTPGPALEFITTIDETV